MTGDAERAVPSTLLPVRCPECRRLACRTTPGAIVETRCARCRIYFRVTVGTPETA